MALAGLSVGTLATFQVRVAEVPARTGGPGHASAAKPVARDTKAYAFMLDPRPALGVDTPTLAAFAPVPTTLRMAAAPALRATTFADAAPVREAAGSLAADARRFVATAPVPVPNPRDARFAGASTGSRAANRSASRRTRVAAVPAPDNRSFFERLFGVQPAAGPALSYASLDNGPLAVSPEQNVGRSPAPAAGPGVAVYDISARTVTLPSGERLEAHSGLGDKLDDPRFVHVRMHGATPPGLYDLTERESLFHGVRALRLNPVGGSGTIFGRAGLLTHTFMLGPRGDSNGCISFRNYDRFLQAYLRGEIRRLVVVAGRGGEGLPGLASRLFGSAEPAATQPRDTRG